MKHALCTAPILILPDIRGEFIVENNTSDNCIGWVLQQDYSHGLKPIAYYSKKLTGTSHNNAIHERELLDIVVAVKKW